MFSVVEVVGSGYLQVGHGLECPQFDTGLELGSIWFEGIGSN